MLDPTLLRRARSRAEAVLDLERQLEIARADYHHAIRQLHLNGGTLREIAAAIGMSHQRVGQIVSAATRSWLGRLRDLATRERRLDCSFCGRSSARVDKLVAGPEVYICDRCIKAARRSVEGARPRGPVGPIQAKSLRCSFCAKAAGQKRRMAGTQHFRICAQCLPQAERFAEGSP